MKIYRIILSVVLLVCISASICVAEESEWMNILFLGGDSRSKTGYERTDSMIIVSVNQNSGELKMTSIMRDTYVQYSKNKANRINAANVFGGPELAMKVVNENFDLDITDYVLVNMTDLMKIIDMVGGIDIEVSESERKITNQYAEQYQKETGGYEGNTTLSSAGYCHLNGLLAVSYARNRYTDSDYGRVMRQQKVLLALADKMQNMEIDVLMSLTDEIMSRLNTNLENETVKDLAYTVMAMELNEVEQYRVPADGTYKSGMFDGMWLIKPDFEANARLLHEFIYGE